MRLAGLVLACATLAGTNAVAEPDVYLVARPRVLARGVRTFVLLGDEAPPGIRWTPFREHGPGAEIVPIPSHATMELTLLGTDGAMYVSTSDCAYLRRWNRDTGQEAVGFDAKMGEFQIAIAGHDDAARFRDLGSTREPDATERRWLERQGKHPADLNVTVRGIAGTGAQAIVLATRRFTDNTQETVVRNGNDVVGTFGGRVIGGLTTFGHDYILVVEDNRVRAYPTAF